MTVSKRINLIAWVVMVLAAASLPVAAERGVSTALADDYRMPLEEMVVTEKSWSPPLVQEPGQFRLVDIERSSMWQWGQDGQIMLLPYYDPEQPLDVVSVRDEGSDKPLIELFRIRY